MIDLDDPRFNRFFELPANPGAGRDTPFKVKYTDYGYRNEAHPDQENVLLFFPPLMASRLLQVTKDELAKKHKIRIISLDRPGIGGTDPASPDKRLALWQGEFCPIRRFIVEIKRSHLHAEKRWSRPSSLTSGSSTFPSPATAAVLSGRSI